MKILVFGELMNASMFIESGQSFFGLEWTIMTKGITKTDVFLNTRNRSFVPELLITFPSCKIIHIGFNYYFSLLFLLLVFCLESSFILSLLKAYSSHMLQFLMYLYMYFPGCLRIDLESMYLR